MARIKYPKDFLSRTVLFKNIKAKYDEDPAGSPLTPFFLQNGIDLEKDKTRTNKAIAKDDDFGQTDRNGEDYTEDRNLLFKPVVKNMKDELQFLKKLYVGNAKELGSWGARVDEERVVFPGDFIYRASLFNAMHKKHESYPAGSSPLELFLIQNNINMAADLLKTTKAEASHELKEQAKRDAEDYREARDLLFNPVMENVRLIGGYLKSLFVNNEKELGHWGYDVDDSPRQPRFRKTTIASGSIRTLKGVKLLSELENTGTIELLLHKGKAAGKRPVVLLPAKQFTIVRGWGTLSVENKDLRESGEISYKTTNIGRG